MKKGLLEIISTLEDPRMGNKISHKMIDIVVIAVCGTLCGAESWTEIELFGQEKEEWLRQYLELPNGIPAHDTFRYFFMKLDPQQFQRCFIEWTGELREEFEGEGISIDGKTVRHSYDNFNGQGAIHMVSAWANENEIVLGQIKVDEKSNEITAIPQLLQVLELKGCIVTMDAMGCQKEIVKEVREQGAEYLVALKENQGHLYEDTQYLFEDMEKYEFDSKTYAHDYHKAVTKGHGRIDIRECWVVSDPEILSRFRSSANWKDLKVVIQVKRERREGEKVSKETKYYISSLAASAKYLLNRIRGHWGIENRLHWVLDVVFKEDASRVRSENSAENYAIVRQVALNLLRQEKTYKRSVKGKRLRCALNEDYLSLVLFGV